MTTKTAPVESDRRTDLKAWKPAREAARWYNVSTSTIHRWKRSGRIEFLQPGGSGGTLLIRCGETTKKRRGT